MSVLHFDKSNFENEVLRAQGKVLVDFWAPWCAPCRMLGPVVEELSEELDGSVKFGKVNVDENGELAQKYGIFSIPALFVFENGQVVKQAVGFHTKEQLSELLK